MESRAVARYVRMSPSKLRRVADLIKGKNIDEALSIAKFCPRNSGHIVGKVLESAAANAENNFNMLRDQLWVKRAYVDPGPTLKRIQPRAMGRAFRIRKRTAHVTIVLSDKED